MFGPHNLAKVTLVRPLLTAGAYGSTTETKCDFHDAVGHGKRESHSNVEFSPWIKKIKETDRQKKKKKDKKRKKTPWPVYL